METLKASDIGLKPSETPEAEKKEDSPLVLYWLGQIEAAMKREKKYRKDSREFIELYEGDKCADFSFNILYSNTETMAPALFNSVPRPIVKRRHLDKDPLGLLAGKIGERLLTYLLDDGGRESPDFGTTFEAVVQSALVPGRGIPWVSYDPVFEQVPEVAAQEAATEEAEEEEDPAKDPTEPKMVERVAKEYVCVESVEWDGFCHGFANSWGKVPWISRELELDRAELIKLCGEEIGKLIPLTETSVGRKGDEEENRKDDQEGNTGQKTALVHQIWDKSKRKVLYICPAWKAGPIRELDDPLELDGFFPIPEPLRFFKRVNSLVPVALYTFYREQAKELNRVTTRINKIVNALKVRGFYDQNVGEIKAMLESDDNVLTPVNGAAVAAGGNASGLDKAIWLMPIEKLITVLQQLYVQRGQIKQVIYEITGLSDILRGASVASETATAQEIKAEWGGLRLKRLQKAVMVCVRDTLRIMLEVAVSRFDPKAIRAMTGVPLPTAEEKAQLQMQMQELVAQQQEVPQDMQAALAMPTFDEALGLLKDDLQRKYRIDIETNSTIDAEATEDKKDIAEMMNAMAQFLSGVQPMVENGSLPFEAAQAMLLAVTRRYRFGSEVEDKLMEMKPPQTTDPKQLEQAQKQLEQQGQQLQQQQKQIEQAALDLKAAQEKAQQEIENERRQLELEKQFALKEIQMVKSFAEKELAMKEQVASEKISLKEQVTTTKQQIQGARLADQKKEVEGKAKEVDKKGTDQTAVVTQLAETIKELSVTLSQAVVDGMTKAAAVNRKLVKGKDGSWSTQTVQ